MFAAHEEVCCLPSHIRIHPTCYCITYQSCASHCLRRCCRYPWRQCHWHHWCTSHRRTPGDKKESMVKGQWLSKDRIKRPTKWQVVRVQTPTVHYLQWFLFCSNHFDFLQFVTNAQLIMTLKKMPNAKHSLQMKLRFWVRLKKVSSSEYDSSFFHISHFTNYKNITSLSFKPEEPEHNEVAESVWPRSQRRKKREDTPEHQRTLIWTLGWMLCSH